MLLELARERPNALAVDDGTRTRSFSELVDRARRFAHFLSHEAGIEPGGHLALLMGNRVEGIELLLGGILVPMPTQRGRIALSLQALHVGLTLFL